MVEGKEYKEKKRNIRGHEGIRNNKRNCGREGKGGSKRE